MIPAWLINLLVSLAIKIGLPYVAKLFPWLPKEILAIIEELLNDLTNPDISNSSAKKRALRKMRAEREKLSQVGVPSDLVK